MTFKVFVSKLPDLAQSHDFGPEFLVIPLMLVLYAVTAWLIHRGKQTRTVRLVIQGFAFLLLGIVFSQCLCNTKNLTLGVKNLLGHRALLGFGWAWLALVTVLLTVALRRKARSFYCHWICPLGFAQDLVGKMSLHRIFSRGVKLAVLAILAAGLILAAYIRPPYPLMDGAGVLLTFIVVVVSAVSLLYPERERMFYHLKYPALILWIALNAHHRISGPWCPIGVSNSEFLILFIFVVVLIVALLVPRAWCRFVCPDGALFNLLSGRRQAPDGKERQE